MQVQIFTANTSYQHSGSVATSPNNNSIIHRPDHNSIIHRPDHNSIIHSLTEGLGFLKMEYVTTISVSFNSLSLVYKSYSCNWKK